MIDRVWCSKDKAYLVDKLSRSGQNTDGVFENNKDLFLFAASLGFSDGVKRKLEDKRGKEILLGHFQRSKDNIDYIDLIALGDTEDVYILDWEDEQVEEKKITIFEEYVNRGFEIIEDKVFNTRSDVYDNILQLINSEINSNEQEVNELINLAIHPFE